MERAIRGRISAGRAAGELPTDADIDALAGLRDQGVRRRVTDQFTKDRRPDDARVAAR
jgi:hypothetical protein